MQNLMDGYLSLAARPTTPRFSFVVMAVKLKTPEDCTLLVKILFIWLSILDAPSLIAVTASEEISLFRCLHPYIFICLNWNLRCIGLDVGFGFRILTQGHRGWNQTLACRQNDGPAMITLMELCYNKVQMKLKLKLKEAVVGQNRAGSTLGTSAPVADRIGSGAALFPFNNSCWRPGINVGLLEVAVSYARLELSRFFGIKSLEDLLQDCIALLAYEEPTKSSVGYLLNLAQREAVADAVNAMVLSTNPGLQNPEHCLQSSLEKLLRQLTACCLERRLLNGEQGEIFCLHKILHGSKEALW
eukprot:Gb_30125 [translate_table: standard]